MFWITVECQGDVRSRFNVSGSLESVERPFPRAKVRQSLDRLESSQASSEVRQRFVCILRVHRIFTGRGQSDENGGSEQVFLILIDPSADGKLAR